MSKEISIPVEPCRLCGKRAELVQADDRLGWFMRCIGCEVPNVVEGRRADFVNRLSEEDLMPACEMIDWEKVRYSAVLAWNYKQREKGIDAAMGKVQRIVGRWKREDQQNRLAKLLGGEVVHRAPPKDLLQLNGKKRKH